jgi:hypothetical protein
LQKGLAKRDVEKGRIFLSAREFSVGVRILIVDRIKDSFPPANTTRKRRERNRKKKKES